VNPGVRLVVVDDQALVRAGLVLIIDTEQDLTVVAEASDGEEALAAVDQHRPDVVLMDVRMPNLDGIEATRRLAASEHSPPVLVLTTFDDDDVLWGALEAGAAGFVLKDTDADDLVRAVRVVVAGGSWLDPRVTPRLLQALRSSPARSTPARSMEMLSARENDVLRLMAHGANNGEIAAALYVSERTVKSHISSIFTKLDARDRAAAIVMAYEAGLVVPGEPAGDGR
jgi:DNA-binding NarL/FixJ family response regulator